MSDQEINYERCTSDVDTITQVAWNDEHPTLFINLKRKLKSGLFNCYNSLTLSEWLRDPENVFAKWVAQPGKRMEENGLLGRPDLNHLYVRLYTPNQTVFLEYDQTVKDIADGTLDYMIFDAEYVGQIRIGNRQGHITVSGLHGQAPGEFIYRLVTPGHRVKGYGDPATKKARAIIAKLKSGQEEPLFGVAVNLSNVRRIDDLKPVDKLYSDATARRDSNSRLDPQLIFSYNDDEWTLRLEDYSEDGDVNQTYYPVTQNIVEVLLRNFIHSRTRIYDVNDVTVSA